MEGLATPSLTRMVSSGQNLVKPLWNRLAPTKAVNHSHDICDRSAWPLAWASASEIRMKAPAKMGTFSQYPYPDALARYAQLGRFAGCTGKDDHEVFEEFIAKLESLKEKIGIKKSIKEYGVDEKYFLDTLDDMVEQAFNDQCTGANPRYPLMKEIKELYLKCYYGNHE